MANIAQSDTPVQYAMPRGKTGCLSMVGGFEVFVDDSYSETMRQYIRSGYYEGLECRAVLALVKPSDRVLEAGTALGVVSMTAASIVGVNHVVTFEANPAMVEAARDNFQRNGFEGIRANIGVLTNRAKFSDGKRVPFYVSRSFWASRLGASPEHKDIVGTIEVPTVCLEEEIRKHDANVIVCDIEGGEIDLFDGADLTNISLIILEAHEGFVGKDAIDVMIKGFVSRGFALDSEETKYDVLVLRK